MHILLAQNCATVHTVYGPGAMFGSKVIHAIMHAHLKYNSYNFIFTTRSENSESDRFSIERASLLKVGFRSRNIYNLVSSADIPVCLYFELGLIIMRSAVFCRHATSPSRALSSSSLTYIVICVLAAATMCSDHKDPTSKSSLHA